LDQADITFYAVSERKNLEENIKLETYPLSLFKDLSNNFLPFLFSSWFEMIADTVLTVGRNHVSPGHE